MLVYFLELPIVDKYLVDKIGYIADIVDRYRYDPATPDPKVIRLIKIILEIIRLIIIIITSVIMWYLINYIGIYKPKMFVDEILDYKLPIIGFIITLMFKYFVIYIFEKDLVRKPEGYSRVYLIQLYIAWFIHTWVLIWRIFIETLYDAKYYRTVIVLLSITKHLSKCIDIIFRPIVYLIIIAKWKYYDKLSDKQKQLFLDILFILSFAVLGYLYFSLSSHSINFTPNPNHYLKYLLWLLITITNKASRKLEEFYTKLGDNDIKLIKTEKYSVKLTGKKVVERYRAFTFSNVGLLNHKEALRGIYNNLMKNPDFLNFGKNKIVIITAILDGIQYNFQYNTLLTKNTSFEKYYSDVKSELNKHYSNTSNQIYLNDRIPLFYVKVWNMDVVKNNKIKGSTGIRNYSTKLPNTISKLNTIMKDPKPVNKQGGFITPLKLKLSYIDPTNPIKAFGTMDIETINLNNKQIPIAISSAYQEYADHETKPKSRLFLINRQILDRNPDRAVLDLFTRYFNYIERLRPHTIFVHNLGSFDGYFIMKYLTLKYENDRVSCIIDDSNKFIQISLDQNTDDKSKNKDMWRDEFIHFKDSYRIFPISLDKLCLEFGCIGKLSKYNPAFNNKGLFKDKNLLLAGKNTTDSIFKYY